MVFKHRYYIYLCVVCFLAVACVSKDKYEELEETLADTRAILEQKSKNLEELERKRDELKEKLNQFAQDKSEVQSRLQELEKKEQVLSETIAQKQALIVRADEARRRLENKLQSQIEQREQRIKELEEAVAKLNETRQMLEINLLAQLENQARTIKEQQKMISELGNQKHYVEIDLIDLKEQIAIQERIINEQMQIIAELDSTRLKIEDSLQDRTSEIELREKRIKELQDDIVQRDRAKSQIETDLKEQIRAQEVKLEKLAGKLKVTFVDRILFNSGSAEINAEGRQLLSTLAESLKQNNQNILVEGHTDNVPIGPELREKYPTNWDLSVARSAAVVRYLTGKPGIAPKRFAACGYSFYMPVASNNTEASRQQNRRIEIILTSQR
ncbi:MAG: OmpA family protein [Desulfobacterales bacterium]|nr:MAG: OmpA family protein [Desulfobacterales bacterium]